MQRYQRIICRLHKTSIFVKPNQPKTIRYFSTEKPEDGNDILKNEGESEKKKVELGGFAKAFLKYSAPEPKQEEEIQSFAYLMRHSKFVDIGNPDGKVVVGKIFHVVGDDLYIDFGWKFHCVCQRPVKNGRDYVRGAIVRIRIKDLELSTKFLGATKDLTILEADCTLTALVSSPMKNLTTL